LKGKKFEGEVHAVATTQEEIGTRGAITSSYSVNPQVGIAYDVTFATDSPDMKESDIGIVKMGGGPVIVRGPNINPILFNLFVETAKELDMPYQILAAPRATGTDARSIQIEEVINQLEFIKESAAIAISPKNGGPSRLVIYAVGIPSSLTDEDKLKNAKLIIRERLNPLFKIEKLIEIDLLPRTASGKVMRRKLRDLYLDI